MGFENDFFAAAEIYIYSKAGKDNILLMHVPKNEGASSTYVRGAMTSPSPRFASRASADFVENTPSPQSTSIITHVSTTHLLILPPHAIRA
jgi:hypothetical protein